MFWLGRRRTHMCMVSSGILFRVFMFLYVFILVGSPCLDHKVKVMLLLWLACRTREELVAVYFHFVCGVERRFVTSIGQFCS